MAPSENEQRLARAFVYVCRTGFRHMLLMSAIMTYTGMSVQQAPKLGLVVIICAAYSYFETYTLRK